MHNWGVKHRVDILLLIVALFLLAQYVGLFIVNSYIDYDTSRTTGTFTAANLPSIGGEPIERPQIEASWSPLLILTGVLVGTVLVFVIMWLRKPLVWRLWFFLASVLCLYVAAFAVTKSWQHSEWIAFGFAMVLSLWKFWKPNVIVQNVAEVLTYGGIAAVFFSITSVPAMVVLLFLVSLYDAYAVWKSKHMVAMAQFQTKAGVFAGLMLPYSKSGANVSIAKTKSVAPTKKSDVKVAILGGGDIAFPLLFSSAVLKQYALSGQGWFALVIPPFVAMALLLLMYFGKNDRFYPAMPFLSAGCFVGLFVVWLLA